MVNRSIVLKKLEQFNNYFSTLLVKCKNLTKNEFLQNKDLQSIILFNLFQSIQTCLDLGSHIISDENLAMPDSNAEIFEVLADNKIITNNISTKMKKATGLRNLIVHEYGKLDLNRLYKVLNSDIKDLNKFCNEIVAKFKL